MRRRRSASAVFATLADPSPIRAWTSADSAAPYYCLPIRSIARANGLASSTVSRAIGDLVDLGLVERRQRGDGQTGLRSDGTVWGISLEPAIRSYPRIAGERECCKKATREQLRAIRDDVRAPLTRAAKALRRRGFSESVRDGLRRIERLRREAKRIVALAGRRRERIAALVRATKALVAELIGDPRKPASATEIEVVLSTLGATELAIESSPLSPAAKAELLAGAESIREKALSGGDSAEAMRMLAEWRSRAIAGMTESRRSRPEGGTAIQASAEPKNAVRLHVTQCNKDSSDSDRGGIDEAAAAPAARFDEMENCAAFLAAVEAASSIMSERFAESAKLAAREGHAGESLAWVASDLLCGALGVPRRIWREARRIMGPKALVALAVADRNRFHPNTPVEIPGAVLRAMTRRYRVGLCNLELAVEAIRVRESRGSQPGGAKSRDAARSLAGACG
ncbi:MAG: hypothetical protein OXI87_05830 [Albidovulum sp.]|nr:hypothetical protein [Albidovulum sp.]